MLSLDATQVVAVDADGMVFEQGDAALYCWRVVRGCVRTVQMTEDGRRHINDFFFPGDFLGLHEKETYYFAAEAVTPSVLERYRRAGKGLER